MNANTHPEPRPSYTNMSFLKPDAQLLYQYVTTGQLPFIGIPFQWENLHHNTHRLQTQLAEENQSRTGSEEPTTILLKDIGVQIDGNEVGNVSGLKQEDEEIVQQKNDTPQLVLEVGPLYCGSTVGVKC